MTEELKPCPFCGQEPEQAMARRPDGRDQPVIACRYCSAIGPINTNTREPESEWQWLALQAWNQRAE